MNKKHLTEAEKRERSDRCFKRFMIWMIGIDVILITIFCGVLWFDSTAVNVYDQPITEGPYAGHGIYTGSINKKTGNMVNGTIEFDHLGTYTGTFWNNVIFGVGSYTYADGTQTGWQLMWSKCGNTGFESTTAFGFTKNGLGISETYGYEIKNGTTCGNVYIKENDLSYTGQWKDGEFHGEGTAIYANGLSYTGQWKDGEFHGEGTFSYPNDTDTIVYEGSFESGLMHGIGTLKYTASNIVYEGSFESGLMHGIGTLKYTASNIVYEGSFENNLPHGTGTWKYANGDVYTGEVFEGKRDGEGTLTWKSTGSSYTGHFENGELAGYGTFTYRDGTQVSGVWEWTDFALVETDAIGELLKASELSENSADREELSKKKEHLGFYTGMLMNGQRYGYGTFRYIYTEESLDGLLKLFANEVLEEELSEGYSDRIIAGEFKEDLLDGYIKIIQTSESQSTESDKELFEWFADAHEGIFSDRLY